ncbi:AraC family transcriptional regulator [Pseudomonas aeruginosa]|uniref:AraC-like transcriptional regulator QhpR n=1 Tax=Pseudomonas aeruginosa TaxID=287 RepID=UPI0029553469|nr:AraC family transcriptional regulator [Pseudomonas aeruginosa]MDV7888914.1 AraC family transcriptional regulator [Pseudomonas aeruginosa]
MTPASTARNSIPGTVLASAATGFEAFVESQGADIEQVLGRAGLPRGLASHPSSSIPLSSYCRALDEAARATQNDNLALWYGDQFQPQSFGLMGYLAISSPTLGYALQRLQERFPIHQQYSYVRLTETSDLCHLEYQICDSSVVSRRHDAELSLCMFLNIMRHALSSHWAPLEVHFQHAKPEAWQEHRWVFGAEVKFGQTHNALVFKGDVLTKVMPGADPNLQLVICQALDALAATRPTVGSLAQLVKMQIIDMIQDGVPPLDVVANRLNIPSWTLHRRLSREDVSFKFLVEEVRKELVPILMRQQPLTISELAIKLGYSEVSAFSRAFQRWHGVSPKHWQDVWGACQNPAN